MKQSCIKPVGASSPGLLQVYFRIGSISSIGCQSKWGPGDLGDQVLI